MVYKPNIPAGGDKLRLSRADIQTNFSDLDTIFDVDHVKYSDDTGDAGKHAATTFVNRTDKSLTIPPTTTAEELAIYVKDASGTPRLFYQEPDSAGAGNEIQIGGPVNIAATGECGLFGGLGLKWGTVTFTTIYVLDYTTLGLTDFSTATYSISVTGENNTLTGSRYEVNTVTNTGFNIVGGTSGSQTVRWMAIGA